MTRKSDILINNDTIASLKQIAESENSFPLRHRAEVLLRLYVDSWSIVQTAKHYKISRNSITKWYKRFEAHGVDGLSDNRRSGRPILASASYIEALEALLKQPAPYHEIHGWIIPLISEEMEAQTNIRLSEDALRDLLHSLGYRYSKESETHPTVTMQELIEESAIFKENDINNGINHLAIESPKYTWRKSS